MSLQSPQDFRRRSDSMSMPQWADSTSSQNIQTLPGSATLFGGNDPMLGGPGMMLPPPSPFPTASPSSGFLNPSSLNTLPLDTGESTYPSCLTVGLGTDIFDPFNTTWDSFGQAFGWGFENDLDLGIGLQNSMFENSDIGPVSSTDELSAAWLLSMTPRNGSPAGDTNGAAEKTDPFGRNHDNPWVGHPLLQY
jgi:hypothetical protein